MYESSFFGNSALQAGGIGCHDCLLFVSSVSFINNTALILHGGAIFTHRAGGVFDNTTVVGNSETAFVFFQSRAIFIGTKKTEIQSQLVEQCIL